MLFDSDHKKIGLVNGVEEVNCLEHAGNILINNAVDVVAIDPRNMINIITGTLCYRGAWRKGSMNDYTSGGYRVYQAALNATGGSLAHDLEVTSEPPPPPFPRVGRGLVHDFYR